MADKPVSQTLTSLTCSSAGIEALRKLTYRMGENAGACKVFRAAVFCGMRPHIAGLVYAKAPLATVRLGSKQLSLFEPAIEAPGLAC